MTLTDISEEVLHGLVEHVFHIPRPRAGKWTLTESYEEALHGKATRDQKSCQFLIVLILFWALLEAQFVFSLFYLLAPFPNRQ